MSDRRSLIIFLSTLLLVILVIGSLVLPPINFPTNRVVEISVGSTTSQIADLLVEERIIRSAKVFQLIVERQKVTAGLQAGFYQFEKPLTVQQVIKRLREGILSAESIKVTVPEGLSVSQLAELVNQNFPQISFDNFVIIADPYSGFLFPDTYLFPPAIEAEELVKMMRENFDSQIDPLKDKIEEFARPLEEIVNMAAIVEEEASKEEDRRMIAGILWKRLDEGMRLEVDVASSTYKVYGLPDRPIVSPGLEAIEATLNPESSLYWFYLSDEEGITHYSKNFEEHKRNIDKYLSE